MSSVAIGGATTVLTIELLTALIARDDDVPRGRLKNVRQAGRAGPRLRQQCRRRWGYGPHVPWGTRATRLVMQVHGNGTASPQSLLSVASYGPAATRRFAREFVRVARAHVSKQNHAFKLKLTVTVSTNRFGCPFNSKGE